MSRKESNAREGGAEGGVDDNAEGWGGRDRGSGRVAGLRLRLGGGAEADAPPAYWGFSGTFGYGGAGGDFGNLFRNPLGWDYEFFRQKGAWRVGAGVSYGGFKMKDPYQDELEWGFIQTYLFGTRVFNMNGAVRPYIQVRGGLARLRPRSDLFKMDPLPPDWESGMATKEKTRRLQRRRRPGPGAEAQPGRVPRTPRCPTPTSASPTTT